MAGLTKKRTTTPNSNAVTLQETIGGIITVCGWKFDYIKQMEVEEFEYVIASIGKHNDRQMKEMKKSSGKGGGKFEVSDTSQLLNMPGVKVSKRGKK